MGTRDLKRKTKRQEGTDMISIRMSMERRWCSLEQENGTAGASIAFRSRHLKERWTMTWPRDNNPLPAINAEQGSQLLVHYMPITLPYCLSWFSQYDKYRYTVVCLFIGKNEAAALIPKQWNWMNKYALILKQWNCSGSSMN